MRSLIVKICVSLVVVFAGLDAVANAGKAAVKAAGLVVKNIKPAPAAKIITPAAKAGTVTPMLIPGVAGIANGVARPCGACGGFGRVTCMNCNLNGMVFVPAGFDMFGNPIGFWRACPLCNGTKQLFCPYCR